MKILLPFSNLSFSRLSFFVGVFLLLFALQSNAQSLSTLNNGLANYNNWTRSTVCSHPRTSGQGGWTIQNGGAELYIGRDDVDFTNFCGANPGPTASYTVPVNTSTFFGQYVYVRVSLRIQNFANNNYGRGVFYINGTPYFSMYSVINQPTTVSRQAHNNARVYVGSNTTGVTLPNVGFNVNLSGVSGSSAVNTGQFQTFVIRIPNPGTNNFNVEWKFLSGKDDLTFGRVEILNQSLAGSGASGNTCGWVDYTNFNLADWEKIGSIGVVTTTFNIGECGEGVTPVLRIGAGTSNTGIGTYRTFNTVPGVKYQLRFRQRKHTGGQGGDIAGVAAARNGTMSNSPIISSVNWNSASSACSEIVLPFTAQSNNTTITFINTLDGVSKDSELRHIRILNVDSNPCGDCVAPTAFTVSSSRATGVVPIRGIASFTASAGLTSDNTSWVITPSVGVSTATGTGLTTGNITFSNAGLYKITFTRTNNSVPAGCSTASSRSVSMRFEVDGTTINAVNDLIQLSRGTASSVSLVANDSLNGRLVVLGSDSGQVTLTPSNLPTGFSISSTGQLQVANSVAVGVYQFEYTICENGVSPANCDKATASVQVGNPLVPDFSVVLSASTNALLNTTNDTVGFVVSVSELDGVASVSNSTVRVSIPKSLIRLSAYDANLNQFNSLAVQNNAWTFDNSDTNFYVFTYTANGGVFPASSISRFAFRTRLTEASTGVTEGVYRVRASLINGSGGETNFNNNVDDEEVRFDRVR